MNGGFNFEAPRRTLIIRFRRAADLPSHQRAAVSLSSDEVCHRGGDDAQRPL